MTFVGNSTPAINSPQADQGLHGKLHVGPVELLHAGSLTPHESQPADKPKAGQRIHGGGQAQIGALWQVGGGRWPPQPPPAC